MLQGLLQLHAVGGKKTSGDILHRKSGHVILEFQRGIKFLSASLALADVVLKLKLGIVGQFVIDVQNNIFFRAFAVHKQNSPTYLMAVSALRSFCVARNSVFFAVSSVVFSISPIVRKRNPW